MGDSYTISVNDDKTNIVLTDQNGQAFTFAGPTFMNDLGRNLMINMVPVGQTTTQNGPVIRSKQDPMFQALKNAMAQLPGGAQQWQDIGYEDKVEETPLSANDVQRTEQTGGSQTTTTQVKAEEDVTLSPAIQAEVASHVQTLRGRIGTELHNILDRIEQLLHIK